MNCKRRKIDVTQNLFSESKVPIYFAIPGDLLKIIFAYSSTPAVILYRLLEEVEIFRRADKLVDQLLLQAMAQDVEVCMERQFDFSISSINLGSSTYNEFRKMMAETGALVAGSFPPQAILNRGKLEEIDPSSDIDIFVPVTEADREVLKLLVSKNLVKVYDRTSPLMEWFYRKFYSSGHECAFYDFDETYRVHNVNLSKGSKKNLLMDFNGEVYIKTLELARAKSKVKNINSRFHDCKDFALEVFDEAKRWALYESDTSKKLMSKTTFDETECRSECEIELYEFWHSQRSRQEVKISSESENRIGRSRSKSRSKSRSPRNKDEEKNKKDEKKIKPIKRQIQVVHVLVPNGNIEERRKSLIEWLARNSDIDICKFVWHPYKIHLASLLPSDPWLLQSPLPSHTSVKHALQCLIEKRAHWRFRQRYRELYRCEKYLDRGWNIQLPTPKELIESIVLAQSSLEKNGKIERSPKFHPPRRYMVKIVSESISDETIKSICNDSRCIWNKVVRAVHSHHEETEHCCSIRGYYYCEDREGWYDGCEGCVTYETVQVIRLLNDFL